MSIALIILVFFFVVFLVLAIGSVIMYRREHVKGRLTDIKKMSVDADPEDILRLPFLQRVVFPFLSGIGHKLGNIAPREIRNKVEKRIMYAGKPRNLNFYSLLAIQALVGGAFFLGTVFLFRLAQVDALRMILITIFLTGIGFYLPYGIVRNIGDSRMHQIRKNLPDFLDLLLVSVEAGLDRPETAVEWRLNMPHTTDFVGELTPNERTALRARATAALRRELPSSVHMLILRGEARPAPVPSG